MDLRFLILPFRFFIAVCSATLSASLVERQLAYRGTCSTIVAFAVVRLVKAERSSAVDCARLSKSMDISMALFVMPALFYPLGERFAVICAGLTVP